MQFPQIRLQSQPAQLSIQQLPGRQTIRQPQAIQSIRQPQANLRINQTPSKLMIDQSQAWHDMDLKNVFKRTEEAAQQGKQGVLEGMARRARQGDELMKIENNGNPIARQAKENGHDAPKQFTIGWIPSAGAVKINYQPAEVAIQFTPQQPNIDTQVQKPTTDYHPGSVEVGIKQRENLEIDFVNLKHQGINFEMTI